MQSSKQNNNIDFKLDFMVNYANIKFKSFLSNLRLPLKIYQILFYFLT